MTNENEMNEVRKPINYNGDFSDLENLGAVELVDVVADNEPEAVEPEDEFAGEMDYYEYDEKSLEVRVREMEKSVIVHTYVVGERVCSFRAWPQAYESTELLGEIFSILEEGEDESTDGNLKMMIKINEFARIAFEEKFFKDSRKYFKEIGVPIPAEYVFDVFTAIVGLAGEEEEAPKGQ